jgi:DNA replication protein
MKTTDELVRITSFSGGIIIDASRYTTDELVRIASFASGKGSRVTLRGIGNRTTDELVRIASFGKGTVTIDFTV